MGAEAEGADDSDDGLEVVAGAEIAGFPAGCAFPGAMFVAGGFAEVELSPPEVG